MKDFFNRLKSCRKTLGLSQAQTASKSHFEQKDISRFENGKVKFIPTPYILFLYREGINLNWLYTGESSPWLKDLADAGRDTRDHQSAIPIEVQKKLDDQKEKLLTLQVENKMLKKQIKELKGERKTLMEAFKAIGR